MSMTENTITVTIINPWSGAVVERDITDLTQDQLDAYPLSSEVCESLHRRLAPCAPATFLVAYVDAVGPKAAGRAILGS